MQPAQRFRRQLRGAHRDEAGIIAAMCDQVVDIVVDRRIHALFFGLPGQHFAQFFKICVLQPLVGNNVVQNRNVSRNNDALVLRDVLVAQFKTGV